MVQTMKKENNLFYVALFFGMAVGLFGSTSIVWANEKTPEEMIIEEKLLENTFLTEDEVSNEQNTEIVEDNINGESESEEQGHQGILDSTLTEKEEDSVLNDGVNDTILNDEKNENDLVNNEKESLPLVTEDDLNNEGSLIENTVVNSGWNEDKTQYYQNGQISHGLVNIDGVNYYFDENTGMLLKGIVDLSSDENEQKYGYFDDKGIQLFGDVNIAGSWYYFDATTGYMRTGFVQTGDVVRYYDNQGKLKTGTFRIGDIEITTDSTGKIIKSYIYNIPYLNQTDPRWGSFWIGSLGNIASTGCLPTVAASVINHYLGTHYTPNDIGGLLHSQGLYNIGDLYGSSSDAWKFLTNYFGIDYRNNLSYQQIINELQQGRIIVGAVGAGTFVNPGYTHELLIYGIDENGYCNVYDPLRSSKNGRYHISTIWNQRSSAIEDNYDFGPFFSLGKLTEKLLYVSVEDFGTIHVGDQFYTGQPIAPNAIITFDVGGRTITLTEGRDYTITYSNNTNVGKGQVTITGINGYTGILTAFFDIIDQIFEDGVYYIQNASDNNMTLDITNGSTSNGGVLQIYQSNATEAQKFIIERQDDGYYTIKNANSNKYLTATDEMYLLENGLVIKQNGLLNSLAQKWMIKLVDGKYVIASAYDSNLVLDILGGKISNSSIVQLYSFNGTPAQLWQFEKTKTMFQILDEMAFENKNVISDGNYTIASKANNKQVVSVSNNANANGATIIINQYTGFDNQGWSITHNEQGYLIIKNLSTGKVLDVKNGQNTSGALVGQYDFNGSRAQLWIAIQDESGIKLISALNSSLVLDLYNGSVSNGTPIQLYYSNGTKAQRYIFTQYELFRDRMDELALENKDIIPEGDYVISSALNNVYVIDVNSGSKNNGANVQLYKDNASLAQGWHISFDEKGYATIKNLGSSKVLDIVNGQAISGANVQQYQYNGTYAQKWIIVSTDKGYKIISALNPNLVLDLASGSISNGSNIQIYSSNNSQAQRWTIETYMSLRERLDKLASENKDVLKDGTYFINSSVNGNYVVDVYNGYTNNGANVQIYKDNGSKAQGWIVTHDETGYVIFTNLGSDKVLDVYGGIIQNGGNVQLYDYNGSYAQKWIVISTDKGFKIVSALDSNYVLDLSSGSAQNGKNIQIYQSNNSNAQRWSFQKYATFQERLDQLAQDNINVINDGIYIVQLASNTNMVLDLVNDADFSGNSVQLYQGNGSKAQQWKIRKDENGYLTIMTLSTNKYLTVENGMVVIKSLNNSNNQKWIAVKDEEGTIKFVTCTNPNQVLDLVNGSFINGTKVQIYDDNGSKAQRFAVHFVRDILADNDITLDVGTVSIDEKSNSYGQYNVKVNSLVSNATISRVWVPVYIDGNPNNVKWFEGIRQSDGSYLAKINASEFGYQAGTYISKVMVFLDGDIIREIGSGKTQVVDTLGALRDQIAQYIASHTYAGETWSVCVQILNSENPTIDVSNQQIQAASVMKMFVMGAVYDNYESMISRYGQSYVDSQLHSMITVSDNNAWVNLVTMLGYGNYSAGTNLVTNWSRAHGYNSTSMIPVEYGNYTSVRDTTKMLSDIYYGNLKYSDRMLSLLKQQQRTWKIPAGVPQGVVTANKTGELYNTENDVAIIYAPSGPYILSVLSTNLKSTSNAQNVIRSISSLVYNFFN